MSIASTMSDEELMQIAGVSAPSSASSMSDDELMKIAGIQSNPAFLPNANKVNEDIRGRKDSVAAFTEELGTHWNPLEHPVKAMLHPATAMMKGIAIPFQRAEASVAGPMLQYQRGDFNPIRAAGSSLRGLAGIESPQVGDVIRTTGFGQNVKATIPQAVPFVGGQEINANEALATAVGGAATLPLFNATGVVVGDTAKGAVALGKNVAESTNIPKLIPTAKIDAVVSKKISDAVWKAMRPTRTGKSTPIQMGKFDARAEEAVKDIIANKGSVQFVDELGEVKDAELPQNAMDTAKAIEEGRKRVFAEYNAKTTQAGENGSIVGVDNLKSVLEPYVTDPILSKENPQLQNWALRQYEALDMRQKFTPLEAEAKIKEWNSDLKAQYRSGNFGVETNKSLLNEMVGALRKDLDTSITNATGPGYQELKNRYGAYKALADELGKRLPVVRRSSPSGFFDIADAFASGEALKGGIELATGNPKGFVSLAKAAGMSAGKTLLKRRNDPNVILGNMFKDVDALMNEKNLRLQKSAGGVELGQGNISGASNAVRSGTQANSPTVEAGRTPDVGQSIARKRTREIINAARTPASSNPQGSIPRNISDVVPPQEVQAKPKPELTPKKDALGNRGVVPIDSAKSIDYKTNLPDTQEFKDAISGTSGAKLTPDGLELDVLRRQSPKQGGEESVRSGVFYLPSKAKGQFNYSGTHGYGGSEKIEGRTLVKAPLFVKGATGGKAPQIAYDQIKGKGSYDSMRSEVLGRINKWNQSNEDKVVEVQNLLEKYNEIDSGDAYDIAYNIVRNSKVGNTLPYAVQENIVANAVRDAGFDSVLGYSSRRDGTKFLSELFDVRESHYPTKDGEFTLHEKFSSAVKDVAKSPLGLMTGVSTAGAIGSTLIPRRAEADTIRYKVGDKETTEASTYGWGEKLNEHTYDGKKFDPMDVTAAMRNIPMGSKVKVTDKKTGKSVVVKINDGGPAHKTKRAIDLSQGAWRALGYKRAGLTNVEIEILSLGDGKRYIGHSKKKTPIKKRG